MVLSQISLFPARALAVSRDFRARRARWRYLPTGTGGEQKQDCRLGAAWGDDVGWRVRW